ncbi:HNH endonuclease signature motif containing protein [Morganella psychrotolerans]|uniref:HNH nuclease domain-containing protein n=1 Tax=Morganella psychrotolerans TaxID=368603 RepID=A0A1B8HUK7_9GAMM|nr:HNH endonuclease signature motif containing protein [Morganella psychrotolerans]OBU13322.1 hypothetical protein AYY18_00810 [Morganella psychrotolerans]
MGKLTQSRLRELLDYSPDTGVFTWLQYRSQLARAGSTAGRVNMTTGYVEIQIDGTRYKAHRLAWLYCHGVMPDKQMDHINSNRTDNRIANLREATRSQNQQNTGLTKANKSGRKGVYFRDGKWLAQAQINGKKHHLGRHNSIDEAGRVYEAFCKEHYDDFYRHPATH